MHVGAGGTPKTKLATPQRSAKTAEEEKVQEKVASPSRSDKVRAESPAGIM